MDPADVTAWAEDHREDKGAGLQGNWSFSYIIIVSFLKNFVELNILKHNIW